MTSRLLLFAAAGFGQSAAWAQTPAGAIAGSDPNGRPVSMFPIQAANIARKAEFAATRSATGEYRLVPLPAGTYTVQIQTPLIFFRPFLRVGK